MREGVVVIGASLGGLAAIRTVLGALPADFALAVVLVQHRRATEGQDGLREALAAGSRLAVVEAEDKMPLVPGRAHLAPAGYHVLVEQGHLALSTEGPVRHSRPSIDVALESAADSYGERAVAVLLTGSTDEGARGAASVRARGGKVVVQEPASAESPVLPRAAEPVANWIVPLDGVAPVLEEIARLFGKEP
ncbi:MAG: chemotaxis protein CheB [Planctomycetes bacterium]|nr:chemotaxis protein CheB [Planctomycetota bacterium]